MTRPLNGGKFQNSNRPKLTPLEKGRSLFHGSVIGLDPTLFTPTPETKTGPLDCRQHGGAATTKK